VRALATTCLLLALAPLVDAAGAVGARPRSSVSTQPAPSCPAGAATASRSARWRRRATAAAPTIRPAGGRRT